MSASAAAGTRSLRDPGFAGFTLLRVGFTVAPILFGLDKFFHVMIDWDKYLWSEVADVLPGSATQIMMAVGVVEILAGLTVAVAPLIGGLLVAGWLGVIIGDLVIVSAVGEGRYWDIALRDFGLMLGALTLVILSLRYGPIARRRAGQQDETAGRDRSGQPEAATTASTRDWGNGGQDGEHRQTPEFESVHQALHSRHS
ncbi:MAG TPA: hypothetical protein VHF25_13320 [Nitriliruptorales bacterium]|nr:hypothetical protein [Nitriliruptorales bacterium]